MKLQFKAMRYINIRKVILGGLAVSLLLSCSSVYNLANQVVVILMTAIFSSFCLLDAVNRQFPKKALFILLIYGLFALLADVFVINTSLNYWYKYYFYMFSFITINCSWEYKKKISFLKILEKVIFLLVCSSLGLWILGPLTNIILPTGSFDLLWGQEKTYYSYLGLLFWESFSNKELFGVMVPRNLSIYPEGPFSNLIFSLGLVLYLLIYDNHSKSKLLAYSAGIFSTLSTTGWGMLAGILCVDHLYRASKTNMGSKINAVFRRYAIPALVIGISFYFIYFVLAYKEVTDSGNYLSHVNALGNGWQGFLEEPVAGVGIGKSGSLYSNSTSGLFQILGDGGILLAIIYAIPIIVVVYKSKFGRRNFKIFAFAAYNFIMLVLVIWHYSALLMFFLAMGYSYVSGTVPGKVPCGEIQKRSY